MIYLTDQIKYLENVGNNIALNSRIKKCCSDFNKKLNRIGEMDQYMIEVVLIGIVLPNGAFQKKDMKYHILKLKGSDRDIISTINKEYSDIDWNSMS